MLLSKLIENMEELIEKNISLKIDPYIKNICYDSRKINPGDLFIAIEGFKQNGHDFIEEAIKKGAVAIISQNKVQINDHSIPKIIVKNTRKCLAELACKINAYQSVNLTKIGITGTNGKTTISYITEQIIKKAGYEPGIIGTINHRFKSFSKEHSSTTPDSLKLQNIIQTMFNEGVTHLAMEVSSHALDLYRIHGLKFDVAVFSNLTQDHLDYHHSMENYWNVKQKFFYQYLKTGATSVINIDDHKGRLLAKNLLLKKAKIITTGNTNKCDIYPISITYKSTGIKGRIKTPNGEFNLHSSLLGNFNLNNILSAIGVGLALDISLKDISGGIKATLNIPGRLELIHNSLGICVYIDYAHTPDALRNVIDTIRSFSKGNIITIFGCGGDRDTSKRSLMGKIAAKLSDLTVITSDNPRLENPMRIAQDITKGIRKICKNYVDSKILKNKKLEKKGYTVILDREEAIHTGICASNKGDTILIAGKGHEKHQIMGQKIYKFDDKEKVEKIFKIIQK